MLAAATNVTRWGRGGRKFICRSSEELGQRLQGKENSGETQRKRPQRASFSEERAGVCWALPGLAGILVALTQLCHLSKRRV